VALGVESPAAGKWREFEDGFAAGVVAVVAAAVAVVVAAIVASVVAAVVVVPAAVNWAGPASALGMPLKVHV